jgi:pilus assembly protein CpaE
MSCSFGNGTGDFVSIEISVISSAPQDLEKVLRGGGMRVTSAGHTDLLHLVQPGKKTPAVLVLDVRDQSGLPPALPLLKRDHPGTGVVIVAAKLDPALMLEAMRAGVSEWVTSPVEPTELLAAVQRVAGTTVEPKGEVFAVLGGKGGVGATTVAVNVATTLSQIGSTLLIDLHPSCGEAALFLGCETKFSLADALENTHRLDAAFLKGLVVKSKVGPDLLAAPDRAVGPQMDDQRIRMVVEVASRCYRYVVLDVPRTSVLEQTLGAATSITVVATQELAAIRGAGRMAAVLRQRHGAPRVKVVINRFDKAAEIASEDLEHAVGGRVGFKFPSNYRLAIDAVNKGRPVVVDNHNKLAAAFASYARSLAQVSAPAGPADRSAGLFGRFTVRR